MIKNISIQVKNSRATLFFRASYSNIMNNKKYIFITGNSGHPLFFRASANCSKLLNVKSISNTVKIFRSNYVFRASASCSKILNDKNYFNTGEKFQGNSVFQGKRKLLKNPE